ncbi:acyl-CoA N-acyltransferase [Viridothelium virens]|uniref:Acyl-CoA N-acyltransferase n=1 Tax=Viridothelium virens TaxID=1048519 RepID=A0A6A6HR41_VIRVR|nr:acyl-CoA N-acyltransferase [Viridothelium virens]
MTSHVDVTINIAACTEVDIPQCMEIISAAFQHNAPFVDIYFPNHDTTGRAQALERLHNWFTSDPDAQFLKAEKNGRVLGFAVWTHTLSSKNPSPNDLKDAEDVDAVWGRLGEDGEKEKRFVEQVWYSYVQPRRAAVFAAPEGKGVMVLEVLAVHPESQRIGLGERLTRWGCEKADENGLEAIVEATRAGKRCYERCGFRTEIDQMIFDVEDQFKSRRLPDISFMRRKRRE